MIASYILINELLDEHDKLIKKTIQTRLSSAKTRATKKGLPFELTEEIMLEKFKEQEGLCYYSSRPLSFHCNTNNVISPDRTENELGYTGINTVLVTKCANTAKQMLTEQEFAFLVRDIYFTFVKRGIL